MTGEAFTRLRGHAQALTKSQFLRNVAAVATGIAAAQAISLAFMPFLTRLYGPEAFGALAAFTAVVNIITPLSTLGYANAIVMPQTEEGATAVARLSMVCAAVAALLALVFVFLFQTHLARWTGLDATPGFLYLIPISLLLGAFLSVANQTAIREGLFKAKATSHASSTLLMNIGKLAGGLLAPSGLALIVISLVGNALNYFMLLWLVPRKGAFLVRRWFGTGGIRDAAREQRDFALYRMPQSAIRAASIGFPVIVLTALFNAGTAGQYSITVLVLSAPVMLLGDSVGEVFFPKITMAIRENPVHASYLLKRASILMGLVAIVPFGAIAIWGDSLFPLAFGDRWARAGEYSQWIAIWMASVLVSRPAVATMPVLRLQHVLLAYEVLITAARVTVILIGSYMGNDLVAIAAFSVVNVIGYLSLLLFVLWRAHDLG
ncbi:oligosaccharide flippase family protein [Lysobacter sp. A03]|uniref:lipopolysaccharide biosynthesis protein n=1 Tax=Lysobacter sp. A03 TaxID=1199154 RepID=UPI0005B70CD5|nr:oligosaccharide flippase family protein [Lysobacter sp. A03]KIQ97494.1 O-antigen flippase Wzx [Lysobacter sp. A03]